MKRFGFLFLFCFALPAQAQNVDQLKQVEGELQAREGEKQQLDERANQLAADYQRLREAEIASVAQIQNGEQKLNNLETQLSAMQGEIQAKERALQRRRKDLAALMSSLLRLSAAPDIAVLFAPADQQQQLAEAAQLLASAGADLSSRAASLKDELADLKRLRENVNEQWQNIARENKILAEERRKLASLLQENDAARSEVTQAQQQANKRLKELATKTANLKDLIEQASRKEASLSTGAIDPSEPSAIRPLSGDGSGYLLPVKGNIVAHFGDQSEFFADSRGIVLAARAGSAVIAPFDGKVLFSGPFRSYGQILIIEHRGGYHTIMAGLDRIDVSTGQWLLAGEPVGVMGQTDAGSDMPKLYMELRRGETVIDPTQWLHIN